MANRSLTASFITGNAPGPLRINAQPSYLGFKCHADALF
jgi:hypothetical protein